MHSDALVGAGLAAALRQQAGFDVYVDGCDDTRWDLPPIDAIITDYDSAMCLAGTAGRAPDKMAAARTVIVTVDDREASIRRAVEAGIHGYVLLGCPLAELLECVTAVANGRRYWSRTVAQRMADSMTHTALTSREIQVLALVSAGESNKAIARDLRIEPRTVKSHMTSIMSKLGATSRTQAAGIAAARGLVEQRAAPPRLATQKAAAALTGAQPARTQA